MKRHRNLGSLDKIVRLLIAVILTIIFYGNVIPPVYGIIGVVIALLLTISSLTGFCPAYYIVGLSTYQGKKSNSTK